MTIFDAALADRLAMEGKSKAAAARPVLLARARHHAHTLPEPVSMDSVAAAMLAEGLDPQALGNASGTVFQGFRAVGFVKSERVSTRGRMIRLWEKP